MMKKLLYIILFLFFATVVHSQGLLPRLGEQRAGTASMTFLKIGVGARAVSLAGAYGAMADDASSMHWNPAGLVQIGKNELVVSHLDWLVDVDLEYAGYVHQVNSFLAIGGFVGILHMADMPVTTEYHPYGNGDYFSYNDLVTGLATSIKMTDRFSFGITLKYVREELDDLIMSGVMLDFGTYYWTGFKTLRFAATMRNFGTDVKPNGTYSQRDASGTIKDTEYEAFSPPTLFTIGAAMNVFENRRNIVTGTVQMNHPMDDSEYFVAGAEYVFQKMVALRAGHLLGGLENKWSFGAGLNMYFMGKEIKIDYSYADYTHLNMTQQITFGFEF